MVTGSSSSLPRLADALSEVGDRLRDISDELRALQVSAPTIPAAEPAPIWRPPLASPQPPAAPPPPWNPPGGFRHSDVPTLPTLVGVGPGFSGPESTLWERVSKDGAGSRILAWAGGVVTLAGVVLLLVLAIQRGYLGPLPRVLLGAGLGAALVGIGLRLYPNPNARTGAYALAATGIAVLYLDVIAATTLHEFIPPWAGLLAGLAVAGAGVALAGRWSSELLAGFVVVCCAICAPILTEGFVPLLLGFLLVLQSATTPVQLQRRWAGLCLAAGLPPVLATLIGLLLTSDTRFGIDSGTTAVLALVTSVVQVALSTLTATRRPDDDLSLALLLISPVPTMVSAIVVPRAAATVLPATVAVVLITVWLLHRAGALTVANRFAMAAGGAGVLAAFQATATAFDGNARAIALLGEALLLAVVAERLRYAAAWYTSLLFGAAGLVLTVVFAATPRLLAMAPTRILSPATVATAGTTALLLAVVAIVLSWAATRLGRQRDHAHAPPGWVAAGVTALYGATGAVLCAGLLVSPDRSGFLLGHVLVTVSWTVGALLLLLRGIDSAPLRVAGLALVGAALVKLVLFDLSSLDGIARVAAFLVAGLVLLAAGARYAKLVATRRQAAPPAEPM